MNQTPATEVVKWYTRARKFPQLIGRTPDGMKLWGGPYTITQACGFGLVLFVGLNTMWLWASFGFVGNFLVLAAVAVGVVVGLGRIPVGSRSPLSVASGAWKAVASPQHGRLGGRPVRLRKPHRLQHTVVVQLTDVSEPQPTASRETHSLVVDLGPVPAPRSRFGRRQVRPQRLSQTNPVLPAPARCSSPLRHPAPALTGIQTLLAASAAADTSHRSETPR